MSSNMDTIDKEYFTNILGIIQKQFEKIENHQEKTCDELGDLSEKVVALTTRFDDHKEDSQNKENKLFAKKINKPQWIVVVFGACSLTIGMIMTGISLLK